VASLAVLMLLTFGPPVAPAGIRGPTIDCDCFGGRPATADHTAYAQKLAQAHFLLLADRLALRPTSSRTLDRALTTRRPVTMNTLTHSTDNVSRPRTTCLLTPPC
jgi:hypothetical protein